MHKTIQYIIIFVTLVVLTSTVMGDAFDQTVAQIQTLKAELEQNRKFIEQQLSTLRENHNLNAPKSQFESDEEYAARLRQLDTEISQRRTELEGQLLDMQSQIAHLYRRIFRTHHVTSTLGAYNANQEFFPVTFEATLDGEIQHFRGRLPINKDEARNLSDNWAEVIVTGWLSIDPGYRRGLARVKLEYPPIWPEGVTFEYFQVYHLGDNHLAAAFSPDGKYLATGDDDRKATIWKMSNGQSIWQREHSGDVWGVVFSPDGKYLATGCGNHGWANSRNTAAIWEVSSGKIHQQMGDGRVVNAVAFSPDGRYLAIASGTGGLRAGNAIIWEVSNGTILQQVGNLRVKTVAFSPDGKYLATGDIDGNAILWEVRSGQSVQQMGHVYDVEVVAFSPDGKYLATGSENGKVTIWEVSSGQSLRQMEHSRIVYAVVFSPDGQYIATGGSNGYINFFRIGTEEITLETKIFRVKSIYAGSRVRDLAWHPSGSLISDGKKVYRTLLQPEEVSLASITLTKISGDNQQGTPGAALTNPFVVQITDQNGAVLAGVAVTFTVTNGGGSLGAPTATTDANGRAQSLLTLGSNAGTNTVSVSVAGSPTVTFNAVGEVHAGSGAKLLSSTIAPVNVGTTFTLNITVENITDLAGWQLGVGFNPSVLSAVSVNEGDFLKKSGGATFFLEGAIDNIAGSITGISGAFLGAGGVNGMGVLFSITFSAKQVGEGSLQLRDVRLGTPSGSLIPYQLTLHPVIVGNRSPVWDVNGDGQVNIFDLIIVSQSLGQSPPTDPRVDVNGDGTINIFDIIAVAQHFSQGGSSAAPMVGAWSSRPPVQMLASLNPKTVQQWIDLAGVANDGSIAFQLGITNLKHLLDALVPDKTVLLANYPNPFNPETWIPYELADDSDVQLTIYDTKGALVRQFNLGHQMAGYYTNRHRAVYWDGKSETGEWVASGIYFYHLQVKNSRSNPGAGDFSAMRKMVIRK